MAESSESSSGPKKQLGTIYRPRNLGRLITEASAHDNIMEAKTKTDGAEATLKRNAETAIVLFDEESGFLQRFDPRSNSLTKMHKMMANEMKHGWPSVVSLGDCIYVLCENRSVYRLKYSDKTATWERMSGMIENHGFWHPAVAFMKSIYVVGGGRLCDSSSVEKYDSVTNRWTRLKDKPQSTRDSGVLASLGHIYCFGWFSIHEGYQKSLQRFHLDSATWEDLPPMNEKKVDIGVAEFRGKIYVMGGGNYHRTYLDTNERYDPTTKQWTMLKPMKICRRRFRCFSIDGCIYAVGGYGSSNTLEKYDVENNEWEMVDLPCKNQLNILDSVSITLHD